LFGASIGAGPTSSRKAIGLLLDEVLGRYVELITAEWLTPLPRNDILGSAVDVGPWPPAAHPELEWRLVTGPFVRQTGLRLGLPPA